MLKQIIFIFLFGGIAASFAQNLEALQKIPDTVASNSTFVITTTITKPQVVDFMEFTQSLPAGFTATSGENKGGTFAFKKNEVRIIWLVAPNEASCLITYKVKVPADAPGTYTITGKIIYISGNNERNFFVLPVKKITVPNPKTSVKTPAQKPNSEPTHLPATVPEKLSPAAKKFADSLKLANYIAETESLRAFLNREEEKAAMKESAAYAKQETESSSDYIKHSATRAENEATLAELKAKLDSGQLGINRLKAELENTTLSQKNVLIAISTKNNSSVAKTDLLLAQLKMKSEFNQAETKRLKIELAKANENAASTLRIINLKNSAANAQAALMLSDLKTNLDSGQLEITKLRSDLDKIKVIGSNTSNAISSTDGLVRTSESDYFLGENDKPISNGFYVIIGTFSRKENADRFRATNTLEGRPNSKIIQNQFTKVYNIYEFKSNNRAEAEAARLKCKAVFQDAWILKLE